MRWNDGDRERIVSAARSYRREFWLEIASAARSYGRGVRLQWGQDCNDFDGFEADGNDAADEVYDVARFVVTVGVVDDAASSVYFDAVLVNMRV